MCGIAGILDATGLATTENIRRMTDAIRHRGPDGEGFVRFPTFRSAPVVSAGPDTPAGAVESRLPFAPKSRESEPADSRGQVFLGHRRLAILDTSVAGHQPFCDPSERYWIVYNGEIYNFPAIRKTLEDLGHNFISTGDTEVVLAAYRQWGPECLSRFNGMWSFAIYDRESGDLFAARDRFGVKPFYYLRTESHFAFASEIKPLRTTRFVERRVNQDRLYDYLAFGLTDHTAETLFQGIQHLPPGHWLKFSTKFWTIELQPYYRLEIERAPQREVSPKQAVAELQDLFEDSVAIRMISDVPLGITLSGGLDSTSIACAKANLLQRRAPLRCSENDRTFSILYGNPAIDEDVYIDQVVDKVRSRHQYSQIRVDDLMENLSRFVRQQEEPFDKIGTYSQWHVFQDVHASGVKVTLDGQGGDELFAGYHDYFGEYYSGLLHQRKLARWSYELAMVAAKHGWPKARSLSPSPKYALKKILSGHLFRSEKAPAVHPPISPPFAWMARDFWMKHRDQDPLPGGGLRTGGFADLTSRLYRSFMFESIPHSLRISDRNSMAHSVESRMPFMDFRLVEFAFGLPDRLKIQQGETKHVLREAMRGTLPEPVRTRQDKTGFWLVLVDWLRNERFQGLLSEIAGSDGLATRGHLDQEGCHETMRQLLHQGNYGGVWRWIGAELWFREFMDGPNAT